MSWLSYLLLLCSACVGCLVLGCWCSFWFFSATLAKSAGGRGGSAPPAHPYLILGAFSFAVLPESPSGYFCPSLDSPAREKGGGFRHTLGSWMFMIGAGGAATSLWRLFFSTPYRSFGCLFSRCGVAEVLRPFCLFLPIYIYL